MILYQIIFSIFLKNQIMIGKKNAKEIINKQISILNGETFTEFNNNYNFAQNLFNLAEYNEKENSNYNLEIKEKLIQKFSRISKKISDL